MVGRAVDTMVESRAASSMTSSKPLNTTRVWRWPIGCVWAKGIPGRTGVALSIPASRCRSGAMVRSRFRYQDGTEYAKQSMRLGWPWGKARSSPHRLTKYVVVLRCTTLQTLERITHMQTHPRTILSALGLALAAGLLISASAYAAGVTVTVSKPADGATVPLTFNVQASATTSNPGATVTGWHIYVDGADKYGTAGPTSSINTNVTT